MIKVNKLLPSFSSWCLLKEIENMFSVFLSNYRNTHESLGQSGKGVKTLTLLASVPTAFLVLQNFHLCFYIRYKHGTCFLLLKYTKQNLTHVVFGCVRRSTSRDLNIISTGSKPLSSFLLTVLLRAISL